MPGERFGEAAMDGADEQRKRQQPIGVLGDPTWVDIISSAAASSVRQLWRIGHRFTSLAGSLIGLPRWLGR